MLGENKLWKVSPLLCYTTRVDRVRTSPNLPSRVHISLVIESLKLTNSRGSTNGYASQSHTAYLLILGRGKNSGLPILLARELPSLLSYQRAGFKNTRGPFLLLVPTRDPTAPRPPPHEAWFTSKGVTSPQPANSGTTQELSGSLRLTQPGQCMTPQWVHRT